MAAPIDREIVEALPNFRRVFPRESHSSNKDLIKGHLFRSSKPDLLDEANVDMIYNSGIKSIIDLRNVKEYLRTRGDKFLDKYYAIYYPPEPVPKIKAQYEAAEPVELKNVSSRRRQVIENEKLRHVCLDFFKLNYILHVLYHAPLHIVLISILYLIRDLLSFRSKHYKHFVRYFSENFLNPLGLAQQYQNMSDWSQASICAALKILSQPGSLPAIINCAHGKDRTGILTAIILSMMGVPREEILEDYALSEEGLASIRDRVHHEICGRYHMAEEFTGASRETMQQLLEYIDTKHGSMDAYLDHIGFGAEERQRLRDNLNKPI